ncbi:hypothetical protein BJ508DRAFT_329808 [Ascobolus immersus RN42]|uniref:Uncharacterized protein n=1 Tax=Ascobolus immersus RN42 TaxID=1160509 RepID=A0A3N4HVV1_ASCIM|nr:hypothetical protein BJ508DRAFT_329808 [Ascobolus immersus RN42]
MLDGPHTPDHILVNAAITLASNASENVRQLNANYNTLQSNIYGIAESYVSLQQQLRTTEAKKQRLSDLVQQLLEKESEREERWEKHMNLCIFGEFDQVVERWRKKNGLGPDRGLTGKDGYRYTHVDKWGRQSDEVFWDLMEIMGCKGDYSMVHVKRYPIPSKTEKPGYKRHRKKRHRKHEQQRSQPPGPSAEPAVPSTEADSLNAISSEVAALTINQPDSSQPSGPLNADDLDPPPPCVLVLTTYSAHNVKAAILDAYMHYEKKYMREHKGIKPPFNIREDRTLKEHFRIKKMKRKSETEAKKRQAGNRVSRDAHAKKKTEERQREEQEPAH